MPQDHQAFAFPHRSSFRKCPVSNDSSSPRSLQPCRLAHLASDHGFKSLPRALRNNKRFPLFRFDSTSKFVPFQTRIVQTESSSLCFVKPRRVTLDFAFGPLPNQSFNSDAASSANLLRSSFQFLVLSRRAAVGSAGQLRSLGLPQNTLHEVLNEQHKRSIHIQEDHTVLVDCLSCGPPCLVCHV